MQFVFRTDYAPWKGGMGAVLGNAAVGEVSGFGKELEERGGVGDRVADVDYDDKRWVDFVSGSESGVWES